MNCLCCGAPLDRDADVVSRWHRRCARRFFGGSAVPEISITTDDLESFARRNVQAGLTVPGVQRKMSLHLDGQSRPYRLTLVGYPAGYILKPPAPEYRELPEFEHTVLSLADVAGIRTVPHGLVHLASGERAYITRRVDRDGSTRVPMEDLCQLSERLTDDKYRSSCEQCGKTIGRYSDRPGLDLADYFFLLLFCFVTGNADMHLKNFSLVRGVGGWVLAPAYDLLPTNLLIPDDRDETALTINGKRSRLRYRDFLACGRTIGLIDTVINRLTARIVERAHRFPETVERSHLSPENRHALQELVVERVSVLRDGMNQDPVARG